MRHLEYLPTFTIEFLLYNFNAFVLPGSISLNLSNICFSIPDCIVILGMLHAAGIVLLNLKRNVVYPQIKIILSGVLFGLFIGEFLSVGAVGHTTFSFLTIQSFIIFGYHVIQYHRESIEKQNAQTQYPVWAFPVSGQYPANSTAVK